MRTRNPSVTLRAALVAISVYATTVLVADGAPAFAETDIRAEKIEFGADGAGAPIEGKIQGYEIVDYLVNASAGQRLLVEFEPDNLAAYFNVLPPDSESALFIGSISGNRAETMIPADGLFKIRVYMMRSAARREETATYTMNVELRDAGGAVEPALDEPIAPFDETLELQGLRFHVTSGNRGSINTLRIVPSGLEIDNSPILRTIDGTVTGAESADLDVDGSPEVYVYVASAGSGSYGSLVAYAANRKKSLSEIYMRPITEDDALTEGYMGHDEFAVVENVLVRRFRLYGTGDTNAEPTGRTRQLQYKLHPGEAGWILRIDRVIEY